MTGSRPLSGAGPSVCPFVALAEDRDRRADAPDEDNRCYAEKAPRRRDLVYQSEFCYSADFARCSVFLAWAARNAAEPAYVTEAAKKAWGSGIAAPEGTHDPDAAAVDEASVDHAAAGDGDDSLPEPTPEDGLFGPTDPAATEQVGATERLDWVSASAWAEVPWDERAEIEAAELEAIEDEPDEEADEEPDPAGGEESTQAPKVPAALPMRRRKPPLDPIRSRGSGEWFYADPPAHEPLVSRRHGITPPILLGVLGLLVVSIVVFLVATQLGGGDDGGPSAATSPEPAALVVPTTTRAPVVTPAPSEEPGQTEEPKRRFYKVKAGDTLSAIAAKFEVKPAHLQCLNGIVNKNIVQLGARYEIPPEGFSCPPNWRNATPEP